MINPLQRRGENPSSSKTQLKETVQKKPKPMMSTKFQVHGKIISDFCSVDGTKWRRIPGGIINTIFEEWNWNEDETSSMKKVDQSSISKPLPPRCTYNHLNWRVVYFAILNVQFNILLFQLKDVTNQCPEWKPRRWSKCIQKIKDGSKMTQPFRILSGTSRIQREMGVCCYTQQCTREL